MRNALVTLAVGAALSACVDENKFEGRLVGADPNAPRPRGTYLVVPPSSDGVTRFGPGPAHRLVYMNRHGGTYSAGQDNSSLNRSSVPTGTASVSAWAYGDEAWSQLMACVRDIYAPFDVTLTDVDPGDAPHIESVVGGRPGQIGLPSYVGGVSPFTYDCSVIERSVVYTFADLYGGDLQAICETVAQETAHSFGLDHELDCLDPMTYLAPCGAKSFQNQAVECGEDTPRQCACGGSTQNSYAILMEVLGPSETDLIPPALTILRPQEDEVVPPGFEIEGSASDEGGVESVTLYIDGMEWATDTAAPYLFTAPESLAPGPHSIELRAVDLRGNVTPSSVNIEIDDGGGMGDPGDPMPPDDHGLGAPCIGGGDCDSGFCSGAGTCSQGCDPGDTASCGTGFECAPYEGGGGECLPVSRGTLVGGCTVGRGACNEGTLILLLGLVLLRHRVTRLRRATRGRG